MKTKSLLIGGVAAATLLTAGWAVAESQGHGHGGMGQGGRSGMHGQMGERMQAQMGQGMHGRMGQGMHGQMGQGMHGQMGQGRHGGADQAFADPARIDTLKTELGITDTQEPAWTKYAKAVEEAATARQATREGIDRDALSEMTPADRFAFVSKMREQRQTQVDAVKTAADELLATLDDTQKAKALRTLPGLASGPGAMRGASLGGHDGQQRHRH